MIRMSGGGGGDKDEDMVWWAPMDAERYKVQRREKYS